MFFPVIVSAQTANVNIRSTGSGKIEVIKGKLRTTADLTVDVGGCAYVSGIRKRNLNKIGCAAPPASFELIDSVVKNNQTFLVIQSTAQGNCNVCGSCGASETYTLIWIKLDARLRVLDKQGIVVESCPESLSIITPSVKDYETSFSVKMPLKTGLLTVDFEKRIYDSNRDLESYEFSHLEYDRKKPERGFIIKAEKRAKSSATDR